MQEEGEHLAGQSKTSAVPVTVLYKPRSVTMCYVSEQELDAFGSVQNSVNLAFSALAFGAWLTLTVTLATVQITNPYTYAAFWGGFWISLVLTGYFGIRAFLDFRHSRTHISSIKEGRKVE